MRQLLLVVLGIALAAPLARADIALLANGMTLKIDSHRAEDATVFLTLHGGGEIGTSAEQVAGFVPDEIVEELAQAVEEQRTSGAPVDVPSLAREIARKHGVDPALVLAVVAVESGFQPAAVSSKGAQGLMQLMPGTARELGVANAFDPAENLDGGVRYLRKLVDLYAGDLKLALAAYNAGAGAVKAHRGIPPYSETRAYVQKVLKRYEAGKR
jgi:soluble lytic murein transglycosylase-like protein